MLDIQRIPTAQMQDPSRVRDWRQYNIRLEPRMDQAMELLRIQLSIDLSSSLEETVACGQFRFTERQLFSRNSFVTALVQRAIIQMMKKVKLDEKSISQPIHE